MISIAYISMKSVRGGVHVTARTAVNDQDVLHGAEVYHGRRVRGKGAWRVQTPPRAGEAPKPLRRGTRRKL